MEWECIFTVNKPLDMLVSKIQGSSVVIVTDVNTNKKYKCTKYDLLEAAGLDDCMVCGIGYSNFPVLFVDGTEKLRKLLQAVADNFDE